MKATGIIKNKYFNVYFLLDASSSMTYKWNETIDSINAFVKTKVDESDVKYRYSVMTHKYNAKMQYDVVRDKVSQDVWVDLDYKTVRAGGFTPLYDAMGKLLDSIAPERSIVVILTDGEENSSVECSKSIITKKMKALEESEVEFIFMGCDFDAINQAGSLNVGLARTLNVKSGNYIDALSDLKTMTASYAATGTRASLNISNDLRAKAAK